MKHWLTLTVMTALVLGCSKETEPEAPVEPVEVAPAPMDGASTRALSMDDPEQLVWAREQIGQTRWWEEKQTRGLQPEVTPVALEDGLPGVQDRRRRPGRLCAGACGCRRCGIDSGSRCLAPTGVPWKRRWMMRRMHLPGAL